jgi:hypothetical protein
VYARPTARRRYSLDDALRTRPGDLCAVGAMIPGRNGVRPAVICLNPASLCFRSTQTRFFAGAKPDYAGFLIVPILSGNDRGLLECRGFHFFGDL